jgi:hypothetical protein
MEIATLGKVTVEVDAEQTRRIYTAIKKGGSEECSCAYCRNYRAQLPNPLPNEVMIFLRQCGIDPSKDAEVYEMGETHSGNYCYGGEYYFISSKAPEVDADELPNGFQFTITLPSPLEPEEFRNVPGARCFSFVYDELPWVLDERP